MLKFNIDGKAILDLCKDEYDNAKKALYTGVNALAKAAESHLLQIVKEDLNPHHFDIFTGPKKPGGGYENIDLSSPSPGVHILTIKTPAAEIDDGKELDMKTDKWLFSSDKTKTGKKGKYLVIPFKYGGKASSAESETAKFKAHLTGRIKEEIELQNKARKAEGKRLISGFSRLERYTLNYKDPKTGQMHKKGDIIEGKVEGFDVFGDKRKEHWTDMPLTRVGAYQKIQRDEFGNPIKDKKGNVKATKTWMTFRTASEGAPDKFWYPAPKTKDFLARTQEWAEDEFYNRILPEIYKNWKD